MNPSDTLLHLAMQLPENERAHIAHELLLSLEPDVVDHEEVSAAWVQEIEDRLRKIAEGNASVQQALAAVAELRRQM